MPPIPCRRQARRDRLVSAPTIPLVFGAVMQVDIRKILTAVEEIRHEGGPPPARPLRRAWVAAVIHNPYAGRYEPDVLPLMDALKPLVLDMPRRRAAGAGDQGGGRPAMSAEIRKLLVLVEETRQEMGRTVEPPTRKAVAVAVIRNPFAGTYAADLEPLMAIGEELGGLLGKRAVAALGIAPGAAESYGKAAIVGADGELEHAAAILHPRLGKPLRDAVENGAALVP